MAATLDAPRIERAIGAPGTPPSAVRRRRWTTPTYLGVLVLLSTALRLPLLRAGYWGDETITLGIARTALSQIPGHLRHDAAPPLFYVALHFWTVVFGTSEVATHSLSCLFAGLCIPAAWWMTRASFGSAAGRAAAAITAVLPYLIYYGAETRMYSLLGLLSILAVGSFLRVLGGGGRCWFAGAVISAAAVVYTHDWGLYLVGVLALVGWLVAWRRGDVRLGLRVLRFGMLVGILYAPWLPIFLCQLRQTGAPWAPIPGLSLLFLGPLESAGRYAWCLFGVALLIAAIAPRLSRQIRIFDDGGDEPELRSRGSLVAAICFGTLLAGWVCSQIVRSWSLRYLAVAVVPAVIFLGARLVRSSAGRVVLALVLLWCVVGALPPLFDPGKVIGSKSNASTVFGELRPLLRPGDLVVVENPEVVPLVAWYTREIPGLRYVDPVSRVAQPQFWNGTGMATRLLAATPAVAVAPLLRHVPVGGHVVVVISQIDLDLPLLSNIPFYSALSRRGPELLQQVVADTQLKPLRTIVPPQPASAASVRVQVYAKA